MNIIEERGNQIVEEFSVFDDWLEKYNYLIEMGKDMPLIDSKYKLRIILSPVVNQMYGFILNLRMVKCIFMLIAMR